MLTITERLRKLGVVGKFVEFYGPGLEFLTIADRATLGNMSPEYGATIAICPIDEMTLDYLRLTGRDEAHVQLVEAYAKEQGLFWNSAATDPVYTATCELDLVDGRAEPGRARNGRRIASRCARRRYKFQQALEVMLAERKPKTEAADRVAEKHGEDSAPAAAPAAAAVASADGVVPGMEGLGHGSVVVAAITSCTNTSNPSVMIGAGLLARNAVKRGLKVKPWVKTSLAPGSLVVTEYLKAAGLLEYLAELGFNIVGYGCTTCIGNSGPLPEPVSSIVKDRNLVVASVLSGNRNFEGRIQSAGARQLPGLAAAGRRLCARREDAGRPDDRAARHRQRRRSRCILKDIWPTEREIQETMLSAVKSGDVPRAVRARVRRRRAVALAADPDRRAVRMDRRLDLHPQPAVLRGHHRSSRRRRPTSSARGCSRCSATASRPITSRRPARFRRTARPGST